MMFLIVGTKFVREVGILHKYPKPEYFSAEEEQCRPAYSQLNDKEKAVYHALWAGIRNREDKIQLPYEIDGETYTKLYCLVEKQEGDFFYIDSTYYTARKLREARIAYREDKSVYDEKIRSIFKAGKRLERLDLYARMRKDREALLREQRRLANRLERSGLAFDRQLLEEIDACIEENPIDYRKVITLTEQIGAHV